MLAAYRSAVFRSPEESLPDDFYVVTASNPFGKAVGSAVNKRRQLDLADRLDSLGAPRFYVTGFSPDFTHSEIGYGIRCDLVAALQLGRHYNQDAVFRVSKDDLWLVDCASGEQEPIGRFVCILTPFDRT